MAVPNTTNFSLQDVVDEINPTSDTLIRCFVDSVDAGFVSSHKGDKDRLYNFRGYDHSATPSGTNTLQLYDANPAIAVLISNASNQSQRIDYVWKYVSQTSDIDATVSYLDIARSPGYFTPTLNETRDWAADHTIAVPFTVSGGNAAVITFKISLTAASVDTVPNFPDNELTVYLYHGF